MKRSCSCALVCLISVMVIILPACNSAGAIAISFVQATTQAIDNGQTFNITAVLKNDSSKKGVTWSLTGPGSLTNMTTTSVTYNAPPLGAVTHFAAQDPPLTAMVTATSVADTKKSNTVTITLTPPPAIAANQTLAAGVEGTTYSQQVAETGGAGTLTWTIIAQPGPQPAGLNINSGTGVISGTPTGPNGTFTFTVKVTDSNTGAGGPQSVQGQVSITINLPPAPKISPAGTALPAGTEGTAYSQQFTVSNGLANFTWTVVGGDASLPAGLHSAQSGTGNNTFTISGTPTGPNKTTNFQIKVTDSSNPTQSDTQSYSITVNLPLPPKINPAGGALTAGTIGTTYTQVFTVNNGLGPTFTWTPPAPGTLPAGLTPTISPSGATLTISGTPTGPATTSNFTLKVTDSSNPQQSDTQNYSLQIKNPPPPTITTTQAQVTAAPATVGTAYSFTFQGSGTGTLTWSATGLPADGLSLNASTGAVTGTPASKQTLNITVTLSDTFGQSSPATPFTITVNNPAPPVINTTPAQVPSATVNVLYDFTFNGSGFGTLTWSTNPVLTDNLVLNASTGEVKGTPNTATTLNFSVSLTDGVGQTTTVNGFSIIVSTLSIAFTQAPPSSLNTGTPGNTANVSATVSNDPSNAGVDWTVTCGNPGNANCGSFTLTHTTSGQTTVFTAPNAVPTGGTVTIIATATAMPKPNTSAMVTINLTPPSIAFSPGQAPPSSLNTIAPGNTANVAATVSNDPSSAGVDWTVTCGNPGNANCGSFSLTHTTSGQTTVFTAPNAVPTGGTVMVVATATAAPKPNVSGTVTIIQPVFIITFMQAPPNSMATGAMANLSATVQNDPNNRGVDWGVSCGSAGACGSFSLAHTASGVTTIYTAPPNVPTGNTVTITATTTATPTQNVMAVVTITQGGGGPNAKFNGDYAFFFYGYQGPAGTGSLFTMVGRFHSNGDGTISNLNAIADTNGSNGLQTKTPLTNASYQVDNDPRGTLNWTIGGVARTYKFVLDSAGNAKFIEFDSAAPLIQGSGAIRHQDLTAVSTFLPGDFAFELSGFFSGFSTRIGILGRFHSDASGTLSGGNSDTSISGLTFNAVVTGSITPDPSVAMNGRSTSAFTFVGTPLGNIPANSVSYLIDANHAFSISTDSPSSAAQVAGSLERQSNAGSFGAAFLSGGLTFSLTGFDMGTPNTNVTAGRVTASGTTANPNLTAGEFDADEGGAIHLDVAFTGQYAFADTNGRGTITLTVTADNSVKPFTFYQISQNRAFLMEGTTTTPGADVQTGLVEGQTGAGSFMASQLTGTTFAAGSITPAVNMNHNNSGTFAVPSLNNCTLTFDETKPDGTLISGSSNVLTCTFTLSTNGRLFVTITSPSGGNAVGYAVSASRAVILVPSGSGGANATIFYSDK